MNFWVFFCLKNINRY